MKKISNTRKRTIIASVSLKLLFSRQESFTGIYTCTLNKAYGTIIFLLIEKKPSFSPSLYCVLCIQKYFVDVRAVILFSRACMTYMCCENMVHILIKQPAFPASSKTMTHVLITHMHHMSEGGVY